MAFWVTIQPVQPIQLGRPNWLSCLAGGFKGHCWISKKISPLLSPTPLDQKNIFLRKVCFRIGILNWHERGWTKINRAWYIPLCLFVAIYCVLCAGLSLQWSRSSNFSKTQEEWNGASSKRRRRGTRLSGLASGIFSRIARTTPNDAAYPALSCRMARSAAAAAAASPLSSCSPLLWWWWL